ncbi:MAG: DUF3098 domain-containing protein [Rikenellaceae bacterium]
MENNNKMPLGKKNYIYMIISFLIVIIGFMLMSGGGSSDPNEFNADALFSFRRITLSVIVTLVGFGAMIYSIMKITK